MIEQKIEQKTPEAARHSPQELRAMLRFQIEAGVSDILSEIPINRFEKTAKASEQDKVPASHTAYGQMQEAPRPPLQHKQVQPKQVQGRQARFEKTENIAYARPPTSIYPDDIEQAVNLAKAAQNLAALRDAVEGFEGCPLKKAARNTVFSDGNADAKIMLIGEAPGRDEDLAGKPFVGVSGQLLDKMIGYIGLARENIYITNILPWRPPGNRPPKPEETAACLPFVKRHIELINPDLILLLGGTSAKELLQTSNGISKLRGQWQEINIEGKTYKSLPLFHPAYLLSNPVRKAETWQDLLKVKHFLKHENNAKTAQ